jgi:hypothetical protein
VHHSSRLFALALGYFAVYVPYSAITKALTSSSIAGRNVLDGVTLLPIATMSSLAAMLVTITLLGWWRYAIPSSCRWPRPSRWTVLSGFSTALILVTTTLAYSFDGVGLTFVMLVMRGGVLLIAPIVDRITGRTIRWFSWIALVLSLASLTNAIATRSGVVPVLCAIDLAFYLAAYFIRLQLIARRGKSNDVAVRRRYFVEEQMVATPFAVLVLMALALLGPGEVRASLQTGFTLSPFHSLGAWVVVAGLCSQATGVFGGLLLLDASETSYSVPLNRASSILGGVAASAVLSAVFASPFPTVGELAGTSILVLAIGVLWLGPRANATRERRAASTASSRAPALVE